MAQELGRIERPSAQEYREKRKLLFVPLVLLSPQPEAQIQEMVSRYWSQVQEQVTGLEVRLGPVRHIFHELVPAGGEEGVNAIEQLGGGSRLIVRARLDRGAELQSMEDVDLLTTVMDWQRCLSVGLQNPKVLERVYESYVEARKSRYEHIARQIDGALKPEETGILLMQEGHQVQFPLDMEVFYVAPPALDEIKRWLRGHAAGGDLHDRSEEAPVS